MSASLPTVKRNSTAIWSILQGESTNEAKTSQADATSFNVLAVASRLARSATFNS